MKQRRTHTAFASILASVLMSGSLAMMPARSAMAAPFAYVVGGALSGSVQEIAVIDANPTSSTFNTVIAAIPNTSLVTNLAITPDGSHGYVINGDGTVSMLDTNPSSSTFNSVLTTITPPGGPPLFPASAIAITPSGSRAYAGARQDSSQNAFDSVIDTVPTSSTYNTVVATIGTGGPPPGLDTKAIAITPDGTRAYLTFPVILSIPNPNFPSCNNQPCLYANNIAVVDTATNTVTATFLTAYPPTIGCATSAIAITPDGSRAYVKDATQVFTNGRYICLPQLDVVNLATNTVVATIPLPADTPEVGLAITPDGNHAYVSATSQTDGLVLVIDTNTSSPTYNTVVATVDLGQSISALPYGLAVTPDGALVYLAGINPSSSTIPGFIDVIATATNTIVAQINLSARPTAVAITPGVNKNICPESQGFWKGHAELWPVASLVLGGRTYSEDQLLMLLNTSSAGNAAVILADELIATKLNLDVGSNPAPISSTVTAGDSELAAVPALPTVVRTNTTAGQVMQATAATLDSYNIDHLTPHCTPFIGP